MNSIADQYRTIETGAGWAALDARGRIRVDGRDAVPFLQALLTNDVAKLAAGEGVYSAYLTPNGRMIADLEVLHRGDHLLVCVAPGVAPGLAARLDGLVFAEEVQIADESLQLYELGVVGPEAACALARALGSDPETLVRLPESWQTDWGGGFVSKGGGALVPVFRLFGAVRDRQAVIERLESAGIRAVNPEVMETLRILAARPAWGAELTEETIPLEAGLLDRAISTSKGCYVGQEIIIRMLHRGGGRVARRLVMLAFADAQDGAALVGATLRSLSGADAGRVTSATVDPSSGQLIALAYLRSDHAQVGEQLTVADSGAKAVVTMVTT
ncbi:MAG: glycine cleavage T C-terminal barrel domain-containing protein [Vicinamibacterales bacterium]